MEDMAEQDDRPQDLNARCGPVDEFSGLPSVEAADYSESESEPHSHGREGSTRVSELRRKYQTAKVSHILPMHIKPFIADTGVPTARETCVSRPPL